MLNELSARVLGGPADIDEELLGEGKSVPLAGENSGELGQSGSARILDRARRPPRTGTHLESGRVPDELRHPQADQLGSRGSPTCQTRSFKATSTATGLGPKAGKGPAAATTPFPRATSAVLE